jgi:hypothetical protein
MSGGTLPPDIQPSRPNACCRQLLCSKAVAPAAAPTPPHRERFPAMRIYRWMKAFGLALGKFRH